MEKNKNNTKTYNNGFRDGTFPKVYEHDGKMTVTGVTSVGDSYEVTIIGKNPFYNPAEFGETEGGLLEKIRKASEISSQNVRYGYGYKQGVIVVDETTLVTPLEGVEVVHVEKKQMHW